MRSVLQGAGKALTMFAGIILILTLIFVLHADDGASERAPVKATREHQERRAEEEGAAAFREEQREAEYAKQPGPPAPVKGWEP